MAATMISTADNPFDPRDDWTSWYEWDVEHGYNTCAYLARVASLSSEFPQSTQEKQIEQAIDEIIAIHAGGMYVKLPVQVAA